MKKLSEVKLFVATLLLISSGAFLGVVWPIACANAQPAAEILKDNAPGSVLVFTRFDIRSDTSTQLRIVNKHNSSVQVKLNYVCPGIKHVNEFCASLNTQVSFTPYQTRIIDVADQNPPCNQGYVLAFAMDNNENPIAYDYLYGSYHIYQGRRHETDSAIAIQSVAEGQGGQEGLGQPQTPPFTRLYFTGNPGDYRALPRKLFTDFRSVNDTDPAVGSRLTLLTLDVLAGMQNPPAVAFVDFWNSSEVPFSTSVEFICWAEYQLDDISLNLLEENLGTTIGSMTITAVPNCPIPGACPPLFPYDAAMLGSITEYGDGTLSGHILSHDENPSEAIFQPR